MSPVILRATDEYVPVVFCFGYSGYPNDNRNGVKFTRKSESSDVVPLIVSALSLRGCPRRYVMNPESPNNYGVPGRRWLMNATEYIRTFHNAVTVSPDCHSASLLYVKTCKHC